MLATHYHVFGTDKVGNDVLYQSLKSIRVALVIGTLTTLVMLPFALLLGIMAGYFRGWVRRCHSIYLYHVELHSQRVTDSRRRADDAGLHRNPPGIVRTTASRADLRLLFLCIILGITSWTGLCRLLRGETLKLRELEYI